MDGIKTTDSELAGNEAQVADRLAREKVGEAGAAGEGGKADIVKLSSTERLREINRRPNAPANVCSKCGRPWTDEPIGLTSKQREALLFIYRHAKANNGVPPSFDQIRGALGLKSKSGIHRLVSSLVERGALVTLPYRARAMAITPRGLNTIGKAT